MASDSCQTGVTDLILEDELKKLDDGVPFRSSKRYSHHTWARTFHSFPELYVQPQSVEEIQKAVALARRCRRRITVVGSGHSPSDLTCTSSWMVNLDNFNKVVSVDTENFIVVVQAGIRLWQLGEVLDTHGLALPSLGSIDHQSLAGAIATGTHGSSLYHGIISSSVLSLRITLSNSDTVFCSPSHNLPLFRAALLSLGALGIITEITFRVTRASNLHWKQTIYRDTHILETWPTTLWTQAEYVRVWWFPHTRRATVWHASKTTLDPKVYPFKPSYYDRSIGYHVYHNLLYLSHYIPRLLPWIEWLVFGMQYGFASGSSTIVEAIQPLRQALLMNCLYSQYVNEWAIPLHLGPIALRRLSSWLNHLKPSDPDYIPHGIPYSADGLWVHAPVEVRISDASSKRDRRYDVTGKTETPRPYLDPTVSDGPTLYLNATLYRPYNLDPPCRERYYQAFEYLMRELGGRPHWAKNFGTTGEEIESMYSDNLEKWRKIRDEVDPEGMFVGGWHRRCVLGGGKILQLEEEVEHEMVAEGGLRVIGFVLPGRGEDLDNAVEGETAGGRIREDTKPSV